MTQDKMIATRDEHIALDIHGSRDTVRELAYRLKMMISNGKNLNNDEAIALAQYSVSTDLNPMLGECFYLPGKGPVPGIAGWRKKAYIQLQAEAERANEPVVKMWTDTRDLTKQEQEDHEVKPGDVAVHVTLHESLSSTKWKEERFEFFLKGKDAGLDHQSAWDTADEVVGDEPVWTGVGIVRKDEKFGPDKFNRPERAAKRGEKLAIRKRFPTIYFPEPVNTGEPVVLEPRKTRSETEVLAELGFDADPEPMVEDAVVDLLSREAELLISENLAPDAAAANEILEIAPTVVKNNHETLVLWVKLYQAWLDVGVHKSDAAQKASAGEQPKDN